MAPTLRRIELQNFRAFPDYSITCRECNVLVGENNAGKSSILDALRITSAVIRYAARRNPEISEDRARGVQASYELPDTALGIQTTNICYNYSDADAAIILTHQNGNQLDIRLHPDRPTRARILTGGAIPRTATQVLAALPMSFTLVPPLAPFEEIERWVEAETARANEGTRLASRNFRNIWLRKPQEQFDEFAGLVTQAWPGITISRPTSEGLGRNRTVSMMFEENRVPREVHWSGYGFQVWLQLLTHIFRGDRRSILIFDEPEVFLHPDLQRKIFKIVEGRFDQSFIATHSTEIVNESKPGNVFLIRKTSRSARRINSEEGYRQVYAYLGSSENAELARISRAKSVVFFEGKDRRIIRKFAEKAGIGGILESPDTLFLQSGGFELWRRVKEFGWTLNEVFDLNPRIVAFFDRDYRCADENVEFKENLSSEVLKCIVFDRKEIENYALNLRPLVAAMIRRVAMRGVALEEALVHAWIIEALEGMHDDARIQTVAAFVRYKAGLGGEIDRTALEDEAGVRFDERWAALEGQLSIVSGKTLIAVLSTRLQAAFGCSLTLNQIVDEHVREEIPAELVLHLRDTSAFLSH